MARDPLIEHLLRRIGFGAAPGEIDFYANLGYATALDRDQLDPVHGGCVVGKPGRRLTITGAFAASINIAHARQRWLFRMVHTERPRRRRWRSGTTISRPRSAR
jgi:hypothetical protein